MEMDLNALRKEIAGKIEDYFAGLISQDDLIDWARELENEVERFIDHISPHAVDYYVVEDALWAILLLNHDPEEFATRPEELKASLTYLTGEVPFPMDRVPVDNFERVWSTAASKISDYVTGRLGVDDLLVWAESTKKTIDGLHLEGTPGFTLTADALNLISKLGSHDSAQKPSRSELVRLVLYLQGRQPYPEEQIRRTSRFHFDQNKKLEHVCIGRWELEIDPKMTRTVYEGCLGAAELCGCEYCRNYAAAREYVLDRQARSLLGRLGIDPHCEAEVVYGAPTRPGYHMYEVWFHFVGKILSGRDAWKQVGDNGYVFDLEELRSSPHLAYGFTNRLALVPSSIGGFPKTPVVQLEFEFEVPWVIDNVPADCPQTAVCRNRTWWEFWKSS